MKRCKHAKTKEGPRMPALYGSWETEVCLNCGAYRVNHHYWGKWKKGPLVTSEDNSRG